MCPVKTTCQEDKFMGCFYAHCAKNAKSMTNYRQYKKSRSSTNTIWKAGKGLDTGTCAHGEGTHQGVLSICRVPVMHIWKHSLHYGSMIESIYNRSVAWLTPTGTHVPLKRNICGEKETQQFLFHCRNTWLAGHWHDSVLIVTLLIFNEVTLDYVWFCDLELNITSTVINCKSIPLISRYYHSA